MKLNKWTFKTELKELCEKCTGLQTSTARKYAYDLYAKYEDEIMHYNSESYNAELQLKSKLSKAIRVLKQGYISYNGGIVKLDCISRVEFENDVTIVVTNQGKNIHFNSDFSYLKIVFTSDTWNY